MNRFGSSEWMSRTPNGLLAAVDRDREAAADAHHPSAGGIEKRPSVSQSSTITCRPDSSAAPACELRAAEARRLPSVPWISAPAQHLQAAAVAADLPDAGAVDTIDLDHQRDRLVHQRIGLAVLEGMAREAGDGRLLGDRPAQVLLGDLALGDVVEDAVPDLDAIVVRFQHRLVEDPDHVALAGVHPVIDRAAVAAVPGRLLLLLGEGAVAVLGM